MASEERSRTEYDPAVGRKATKDRTVTSGERPAQNSLPPPPLRDKMTEALIGEKRDNGNTNPLIVISRRELGAWLRSVADAHGYSDRVMSAVQFGWIEDGEEQLRVAVPELVLMVSNIPNSNPTSPEVSKA